MATAKSPTAARAGPDSGSSSQVRRLSGEAPSTRATSSRSRGRERKKDQSTQVPKGITRLGKVATSASGEFRRCKRAISRTSGVESTPGGTREGAKKKSTRLRRDGTGGKARAEA